MAIKVRKSAGLWCCGLALLVSNAMASSLEQIRYALFLDPNADVNASLEVLTQSGDRGAMLLLANRLMLEERPDPRRVTALFQAAFDAGRGEVSALSGLSRLVDAYPHLKSSQRDFMQHALTQFPHERDLQAVRAALEVSLVYPELLPNKDALLSRYRLACLEQCQTDYFAAVHAQANGDMARAQQLYQQALYEEPRAVERLYRAYGDERDARFEAYFDGLTQTETEIRPEVALAIGKVFDRIADLKRVDEQLAELARREALAQAIARGEVEVATDADEPEPATVSEPAPSELIRAKGQYWIGRGVVGDSLDAKVSQVYSMTSAPEDFTGEEAFALIADISKRDPKRGRQLRAAALMVIDWPTLDPLAAHELIQQMIADGDAQGELLLADLYSRGGLDEPDQAAAIAVLNKLAAQGDRNAYQRLALIYTYGRALCRDPERGYVYALVSRGLGAVRVENTIRFLEALLPPEQQASAKEESMKMLKELERL